MQVFLGLGYPFLGDGIQVDAGVIDDQGPGVGLRRGPGRGAHLA
jgi:hypothetical protein